MRPGIVSIQSAVAARFTVNERRSPAGKTLQVDIHSAGRAIEFNVVDPPFNNKKLRLAVAHAIDRKEILQAAYFG